MPPTLFTDLNLVLQELLTSIQSILGDTFTGFYLQGSFALGDFDRHSDCDFIVVIKDELSDAQVDALQAMHPRIYALESSWAQHLEGSYFPQAMLKDYTLHGKELWYLDNGSQQLVQASHCNTIVVRLTLLQHGVVLAGPPPSTLIDPIPVAAFRQSILESMQRWGEQIIANPQEINNRFYQGFAVLNYCRMLHDLHTGVPGSKHAGAEWAKRQLDASWTPLIDHAWNGRPIPEVSVRTPADPAELMKTVEFVRCIIETSKELAPFEDLATS
jgi:hypothetical protein